MPGRGGIQLLPTLPGTKKIDVVTPGEYTVLIIGVLIFAVGVGLSVFAWFRVQAKEDKIAALNVDIEQIERSRIVKDEQTIIAFRKQLAPVGNILDNHIFVTQGLEALENLIHSKVQVKNLSVQTQQGMISVKGLTLDYTTIAQQLATFLRKNKHITSAVLGGMQSNNAGGLDFDVSLVVNADAFFRRQPSPTPRPSPSGKPSPTVSPKP
ncbi:MAG: hypothetical protein AAB463_02905 [Patescibacteria group bacterium]